MTDTFTDRHGLVWANRGEGTDDHLGFAGHETNVRAIATGMFPAGGIFLDVGAHVGLWSLNLAREKQARVVAVEANPLTFEILLQNVRRNADAYEGIISAHNLAAWHTEALLDLVDMNDMDTGGSTRVAEQGTEVKPVGPLTQALPLDSWVTVKPDLIKIDVEGAEANVLWGASELIYNSQPVLFIEMHDKYFGPQIRTDVFDFLGEHGYVWNEDTKFGGTYYVIAQPAEKVKGADQ